jgi:hypothetical protein
MKGGGMIFRLSDSPAGLELNCDKDGLVLAGVPLLVVGSNGFVARPEHEIQVLLKSAYGTATDFLDRLPSIRAVARALNQQDMPHALISAVLLRFPALDWSGGVRIAQADVALAKYNSNEARDSQGRWATDGTMSVAASTETTSSSDNETISTDAAAVPVADKDAPRSLNQCVTQCTDLTLGASKLPPGCTGSREWEFRRCVNTCLGCRNTLATMGPVFSVPEDFAHTLTHAKN